jgi:hypothetical protein
MTFPRTARLEDVLGLRGPGFRREPSGRYGDRPDLIPDWVNITKHATQRTRQRLGVTRAQSNETIRRLLARAATQPVPPVRFFDRDSRPARHYYVGDVHLVLSPDLRRLYTVIVNSRPSP